MNTQPAPTSGEIDVVNEVKKDLVAIRAGKDVKGDAYLNIIALAAHLRITLDDEPEQSIDKAMSAVERDLDERAEFGFKKYGTRLQTKNGRDPLRDAYEECCDLMLYFKQCLLEKRF